MRGVIQTINVSATLRAMEIGATVFMSKDVNENTLRNACVRLRNVTGGIWNVDKVKGKGFMVTRKA